MAANVWIIPGNRLACLECRNGAMANRAPALYGPRPGNYRTAEKTNQAKATASRVSEEQRTFQITLRNQPGVDAIRALRALLKRALRSYGLKCLDAREVKEQTEETEK